MAYKNKNVMGLCEAVLPTLKGGSVDLILVDSPYGTTYADWDGPLDWRLLWPEIVRVLKPNAPVCVFSQQPFASGLVASNPSLFKYELIWQKEKGVNYVTAKKRVMKVHENIQVFYQGQCLYQPQMRPGEPYKRTVRNSTAGSTHPYVPRPTAKNNESGERYPISILQFPRDAHCDKEAHHPTAKPVRLLEWLIRTYTNEGDRVLDFCAGSGSTGVACINTNRRYCLIEKERRFFDMSVRRLAEAEDKKVCTEN